MHACGGQALLVGMLAAAWALPVELPAPSCPSPSAPWGAASLGHDNTGCLHVSATDTPWGVTDTPAWLTDWLQLAGWLAVVLLVACWFWCPPGRWKKLVRIIGVFFCTKLLCRACQFACQHLCAHKPQHQEKVGLLWFHTKSVFTRKLNVKTCFCY